MCVYVQNSRVNYNVLVHTMGSGEMEASIADVNHAIELGGPVVSLLVIRARLKFKLNLLDDAIGIYIPPFHYLHIYVCMCVITVFDLTYRGP